MPIKNNKKKKKKGSELQQKACSDFKILLPDIELYSSPRRRMRRSGAQKPELQRLRVLHVLDVLVVTCSS